MDKNHHLNAPNNDKLKDIEQVTDRSDLSDLYFTSHNEWDAKKLITEEERQQRNETQTRRTFTSIRPSIPLIGLLMPTPIITLALIISASFTYVTEDSMRYTLAVVVFTMIAWLAISILSIKKVYQIFYNHALDATPFVLILLTFLGVAAQCIFLLLQNSLPGNAIVATLYVSALIYLVSCLLSFVIVQLSIAQNIDNSTKKGILAIMALVLVTCAFILMFF